MRRPVRRPPSVYSLDPGPAGARPRFRCAHCGASLPEPTAKRPGVPSAPSCLACGFLATFADAGMGDAMRGVLRRVEALDSVARGEAAAAPGLVPPRSAATAISRPTGAAGAHETRRRVASCAARDPIGTMFRVFGKVQVRTRHGSGIVSRTAVHIVAAKAHVGAARAHVSAAKARIEQARACIERLRSRRQEVHLPN